MLADLRAAVAAGEHPKFVFFWGHRPLASGEPSAACLSQWYDADFVVDGRRYPTAEHYMMAEKARLFGASSGVEAILAAPHPGEAKRLGRALPNFDEALWTAHRFAIVVQGNMAKFEQDPALADYLVGTGQRVLVEASPRDAIWGIGLAKADRRATDPRQWPGLNLLGFALMVVRETLQATRR